MRLFYSRFFVGVDALVDPCAIAIIKLTINFHNAIIIPTKAAMANTRSVLMDIREKIEELVEKIKADKNFAAKFQKDPIRAVEGVLGVDLPDELIEKIIDGVKAKIKLEDLGDIAGKLGGLFKK